MIKVDSISAQLSCRRQSQVLNECHERVTLNQSMEISSIELCSSSCRKQLSGRSSLLWTERPADKPWAWTNEAVLLPLCSPIAQMNNGSNHNTKGDNQNKNADREVSGAGPVARVRVAVRASNKPTEISPNETLSLIWQAFCVLEGSPGGLEVIEKKTRCIRAPLLKRFCRFLENNGIDLDKASSVERLLQREAPHMDWKPIIPQMLDAELSGSGDSRPQVAPRAQNPRPSDAASGKIEHPIDLVTEPQSAAPATFGHLPGGLVPTRPNQMQNERKDSGLDTQHVGNQHGLLSAGQPQQQQQPMNAAKQPVALQFRVSVPSETELRGEDLHAWPLLGKDLKFLFQPRLWPAFCKIENFRMPKCFLPGFGFGLIDPGSNTIRIALMLKFFKFLKGKEDQATMIRCLKALNKIILTESLARGLDWEIISLEKVKQILKTIGVSSIDDIPSAPDPPQNNQRAFETNNTSTTSRPEMEAILALNRSLTGSRQASMDMTRASSVHEPKLHPVANSHSLYPPSPQGAGLPVDNSEGRSDKPDLVETSRQVTKDLNDESGRQELQEKCVKVIRNVEDLIMSMEAAHSRRLSMGPSYQPQASNATDEKFQFRMVVESLEKLSNKAKKVLATQGSVGVEAFSSVDTNALVLVMSSIESLSRKIDTISQTLQAQSSSRLLESTGLPNPMDNVARWRYGNDDASTESSDTAFDIDDVRKRAILSHAAAERDRLKRQRMG